MERFIKDSATSRALDLLNDSNYQGCLPDFYMLGEYFLQNVGVPLFVAKCFQGEVEGFSLSKEAQKDSFRDEIGILLQKLSDVDFDLLIKEEAKYNISNEDFLEVYGDRNSDYYIKGLDTFTRIFKSDFSDKIKSLVFSYKDRLSRQLIELTVGENRKPKLIDYLESIKSDWFLDSDSTIKSEYLIDELEAKTVNSTKRKNFDKPDVYLIAHLIKALIDSGLVIPNELVVKKAFAILTNHTLNEIKNPFNDLKYIDKDDFRVKLKEILVNHLG